MAITVSATEFKATCLNIFDQVAAGQLDEVVVTKRGRIVGVLHPPAATASTAELFGCMRGSVTVEPDVDLTAPMDLEPLDAESGLLHR